jgi:hypothetical protein
MEEKRKEVRRGKERKGKEWSKEELGPEGTR